MHLFSQDTGAIAHFSALFGALSGLLKVIFCAELDDFEVIMLDSSLYSGLRTDVVYSCERGEIITHTRELYCARTQ